MACLGGQLTLVYYLFILFSFTSSPFFQPISAPVVIVAAAREIRGQQALAFAQQRWNQRLENIENVHNLEPASDWSPFEFDSPRSLDPTPTTPKESSRVSIPGQTDVPSRTKSALLNRISSFPSQHDGYSPLERRYIEKRAVCPIVTQTTIWVYITGGTQVPFSTSSGPRPTGIPGDDIPNDTLNTVEGSSRPPTTTATNGNNDGGDGYDGGRRGPANTTAILAALFTIIGLLIIAFIATACYCYRKRRARKLAAARQVDEKRDAPTIVREMGSKGFTALGSSAPASPSRPGFFHPGVIIDRALAVWERARNKRSSVHSKGSDDSELQDWNVTNGHRSVRWSELPASSMQRGSGLTAPRSDKTYPTTASDPMGAPRVEAAPTPNPAPAAPPSLLNFQFPQRPNSALSGSERSDLSSDVNRESAPLQPPGTLYQTGSTTGAGVLYETGPSVLYETGPSRPASSTSSYVSPPPTEALPAIPINVRPLSQTPIRSTFPVAVTPRVAASATSPTRSTFSKPSPSAPIASQPLPGSTERLARSMSPPRRDSHDDQLNASTWMAGLSTNPPPGTAAAGRAEDPFADSPSSGRGVGPVAGPSGLSAVPFPRESPRILPIAKARLAGFNKQGLQTQEREKERQSESKRIVALAMAYPGRPVSEESFSISTHEVLQMHEDVASSLGNTPAPAAPARVGAPRKDSLAATTETHQTHQTQVSAKSYPYAGLIALHAPTVRPLSVSSKARSQSSFGHFSASTETDYGNPFDDQSERMSGAVSFSSSQYLYGYSNPNIDEESVRGRRRSSLSALSVNPLESPGLARNSSWNVGASRGAGARASVGPLSKAEAAQRAAALIQLTSGVRRDRSVPTRSPTPPGILVHSGSTERGRSLSRDAAADGGIIAEFGGSASQSPSRMEVPSEPTTPRPLAAFSNQVARSGSNARRTFSIRP